MLKGVLTVGLGLAISAAPAWGQMGHMHNHQGEGTGEAMAPDTIACPNHRMTGAQAMMGMPGMMGMAPAPGMRGGMGMMEMMGARDSQEMGPGNMLGMATMPMMGARFPAPRFLLAMKEDLNLSSDQVQALEQLQARAYEKVQGEMNAAQRQEPESDSSAELRGEDTEQYVQALRDYMTHMTEARIAMVRAGIEARGLLTPDQRNQLEEAFGTWGMMGHRQGMIMNGVEGGHDGHHGGSGEMRR